MPATTKAILLVCLAAVCHSAAAPAAEPAAIPLAGKWRFALDPRDEGIAGKWFETKLEKSIQLPGILQAQGYGDPVGPETPWVSGLHDRSWQLRADYLPYAVPGKTQVPFLCQPARHYLGAAWYQRDLTLPAGANAERRVLFLERARWETRVWVNGREIGACDSLVAPHTHDLGLLEAGTYQLTVRVDNRMLLPYRPDSHAVSDSMGSTWNGIVGKIELRSTPAVWLDDVRVGLENGSAKVSVRIGNATGKPGSGRVVCGSASANANWDATGGNAELLVKLPPGTPLWDEFKPVTFPLAVTLDSPAGKHRMDLTTGLRTFSAKGSDFLLNGRPVFLRGNHDGGGFPLTGHPPMDADTWRRILGIYQKWGINHVRFHSWCPPEAAFTAADELGMFLQPEPGMWNPFSKGSDLTKMLYRETERMIAAYGNHPSFVVCSPSNEPAGRWKETLPEWVAHFRKADPRRLYTCGTGWSLIDDPQPVADRIDYLNVHRIGPRLMRGDKGWFGRDYSASAAGVDVPIVTHEAGQWCAYPDFRVMDKFTGFLQPGNYGIFRDSAKANGVLRWNADFVRASGKLQLACYKEEVEAVLRSRGIAGFQLLDLHDYMGQGTALVGLLDPFWDEKGYATAADFRKFCAPTVPLARMTRRIFESGERLSVPVEVAHYGAAPLRSAVFAWSIRDAGGKDVLTGKFNHADVPIGRGFRLGEVAADLSALRAPAAYQLVVSGGGGVSNDWNFWVYPAAAKPIANAPLVTRDFNECLKALAGGGRVIYHPQPGDIAWDGPPLDRLPLFWNRLMNPGWSRMLGMWVDAKHPALAGFSTADFADWQWIDVVGRARTVNLGRMPAGLRPIVQPVDDWNRNWKLGVVFEAKVGTGRLLVCTVDLTGDLSKSPAARALRDSLLAYTAGERFQPTVAVTPEELTTMLADTRIMAKLKATAPGAATAAIDGDPNTFWQAGGAKGPRHPHVLEIRFPKPVPFDGFTIMPRQNHRDHEGDIREYRLEASDDGTAWRELSTGILESGFHPQSVKLAAPATATLLRLTALSGFGRDQAAALAEFAIHYTGPAVDGTHLPAPSYRRAKSASTDVDEGG
ncbi:MAG: discoidin domain-containing protein [Verrucomicrobia bacterium]|nr:discoidin domain-containing protein [Verrucomicrobiota bacterium]